MVAAHNSLHHPSPAEALWRWRGEWSEPIRPGVHDHHACSVAKRSRAESDTSCVQLVLQLSRAVMSGLPHTASEDDGEAASGG